MNGEKIINIVVIVAGIDEEYQNNIIKGINACAEKNNINVSYFAAFGGVLDNNRFDLGEYNIYNLINFSKFDGAVLMTNTIGAPSEKEKIISRVRQAGIPAAVFDCDDYSDFYNISIDNSKAMRQIVDHVITAHKARRIGFVSGPLANPEAKDRYDAFIEVMEKNGIEIDESFISFGEFRGIDGKKAVDRFVASGKPMPDAIVCANDAMALSAVNTLEKYGYRVPDDVIVTGFDNTYNARHYSPAITSVARPLFDAGFMACQSVIDLVCGKDCDKDIVLEAEPVFSESCGCGCGKDADLAAYKKSTFKMIDSCRQGISLLNRLTSVLAETETAEDNIKVISQYIEELECEKCCICLCSEWQGSFNESVSSEDAETVRIEGYTDTMSAPLIWDKGRVYSKESFASEEMFPEPAEGGGNISYFLPLHFRERCLGYYIVENCDFPINSMVCHSLLMNISNSIENIRKLMHLNNAIDELDRLYVIDPLCNIYNRNGFIRAADKIFRRCQKSGGNVMISFIDMDGLKFINDNYGHNEGDFALQRLAGIIKECSDEKYICARFGGDEFIIFGSGVTQEEADALERRFEKKLADFNSIINKPYELASSIGTCITDVTEDTKLFRLITQADEKMYEQKKRKKTSRYLRRS